MRTNTRRVATLLAGTLSALTLLVSCSAPGAAETQVFCSRSGARPSDGPVDRHAVIVVGNVANAPRWSLTERQLAELKETLAAGGRIDLVSTAGDGFVCTADKLRLQRLDPGMNPAGADATVRDNLKRLLTQLAAAPRHDGQDVYAALALAAGQLESVDAENRALYLVANGLNDHGHLDFTTEGALGADPDETLAYLRSRGPVPSFAGTRVVATGFGFTTAPQAPLDESERRIVADTYAAIFAASGSEVTIDPAPANGDPIDTLGKTVKPVTPRTVQRPASCTVEELVFDQSSALRFHGDATTFLDRAAAEAALVPIADWLREDADRTVAILGTTARATSRARQEALGFGRARVVRDLLVAAGVDPAQIESVTSKGSYFTQYVDDQAPGGGLIPASAAQNRSVRLTLTDPC